MYSILQSLASSRCRSSRLSGMNLIRMQSVKKIFRRSLMSMTSLQDISLRKTKEGEGFNFFHFMIDLEGGPCLYKRLSGCGSGTEYLAVTPWGDFYPCHQFVGDENFLMGNVNEGITRPEIADEFQLLQCIYQRKMQEMFCKILLQWRVYGKRIQVCRRIK